MRLPILLIMVILLLSGCGFNQNQATEENDDRIHVKNTTNQEVDRKTGREVAEHLVELASSIPDVNDATAVVLGKYAVVGIDVNSKLDRSRVESIKYSVAESLKHDPHGANAVVIADADTFERLRQMGDEIQDGRPVVGILDELAQIVGRLMPDIPSDIIDNPNVDPTDTNNNQLKQNKEDSLEQKQQEQSKHHMNDE
ncbi:YhcN/YlaJ family sporulation lipoprotein [Litchfieldia alkalitelluris]|uniref:YhcN/YlaJ family sporulation lipoprotein n=1 Tax=Litchfieldia alkalitelluris TaxID=304268 RepID=UPI000997DAD1|nr:YhcN/YlaJ family sporulation lipoprotein [Litchfieldia alkalitelluris]